MGLLDSYNRILSEQFKNTLKESEDYLEKLSELLGSGQLNNIKLAAQLAKGNNLEEEFKKLMFNKFTEKIDTNQLDAINKEYLNKFKSMPVASIDVEVFVEYYNAIQDAYEDGGLAWGRMNYFNFEDEVDDEFHNDYEETFQAMENVVSGVNKTYVEAIENARKMIDAAKKMASLQKKTVL